MKTLDNTTADQAVKQVKDIKFWGDGNTFKLISKASSVKEGWMKSTKAMEILGVGCVVQVSTQQLHKTNMTIPEKLPALNETSIEQWKPFDECERVYTSSVAEAVTFVPGVKIKENKNEAGEIISRELVKI